MKKISTIERLDLFQEFSWTVATLLAFQIPIFAAGIGTSNNSTLKISLAYVLAVVFVAIYAGVRGRVRKRERETIPEHLRRPENSRVPCLVVLSFFAPVAVSALGVFLSRIDVSVFDSETDLLLVSVSSGLLSAFFRWLSEVLLGRELRPLEAHIAHQS